MFTGILLIEEMVKFALGGIQSCNEGFLLGNEFSNSLRLLPICSRGFTCQMFSTKEMQFLPGGSRFCFIFFHRGLHGFRMYWRT